MMKHLSVIIVATLLFVGCTVNVTQNADNRSSHPSHVYTYVDKKPECVADFQTDYIPLYSEIYHRDGTRSISLTSTLSIRNTSATDSVYLFSARYNDSYGKELKEYIKKNNLAQTIRGHRVCGGRARRYWRGRSQLSFELGRNNLPRSTFGASHYDRYFR